MKTLENNVKKGVKCALKSMYRSTTLREEILSTSVQVHIAPHAITSTGTGTLVLRNRREIFQNVRITNPPSCNSDHMMLVATMKTSEKDHKRYIKGRKHILFPEQYDFGDTKELDNLFLDLTQHCERQQPTDKTARPGWIVEYIWNLITKRSVLAKIRSKENNKDRQGIGKERNKLLRRD